MTTARKTHKLKRGNHGKHTYETRESWLHCIDETRNAQIKNMETDLNEKVEKWN